MCEENTTDKSKENKKNKEKDFKDKAVKTGISFGSALAMVISYTTWHSVGWAIVHGLMSLGLRHLLRAEIRTLIIAE